MGNAPCTALETAEDADIVVTVPKNLWSDWIAEGDLPGEPWSGLFWSFYIGGNVPARLNLTGEEFESWHMLPRDPAGNETPGTAMAYQLRELENRWLLAKPGHRVYVVAHGRLRGWSPLYAVEVDSSGGLVAFIRKAGAVACTIAPSVRGFQGYRYRWWERSTETPFAGWKSP